MASTVTVSLTETGTVESSRASVHGSTGPTPSPTRTRRRRPIGTTAQALEPTIRTSRAALRRGSQFLLRCSRGQRHEAPHGARSDTGLGGGGPFSQHAAGDLSAWFRTGSFRRKRARHHLARSAIQEASANRRARQNLHPRSARCRGPARAPAAGSRERARQ